MTAKIPSGSRAYAVGSPPVDAEGVTFSGADLETVLTQRLPPILSDSAGKRQIQDLLGGVANTAFSADNLRAALKSARTVYDWQVGEAMAEAYLADHRQCEFPWPSGRDLRNPEASPAGADLVGFHVYMLQGEPPSVDTELDQHFESARKAAQTGGDASLDVILRWLHVASRRMVASSKTGDDRTAAEGHAA